MRENEAENSANEDSAALEEAARALLSLSSLSSSKPRPEHARWQGPLPPVPLFPKTPTRVVPPLAIRRSESKALHTSVMTSQTSPIYNPSGSDHDFELYVQDRLLNQGFSLKNKEQNSGGQEGGKVK
jgi:hypothetical protein